MYTKRAREISKYAYCVSRHDLSLTDSIGGNPNTRWGKYEAGINNGCATVYNGGGCSQATCRRTSITSRFCR